MPLAHDPPPSCSWFLKSPSWFTPLPRIFEQGSRFRHVGVGIKLEGTMLGKRPPKIYYVDDEAFWPSYWRAIRNNSLLNCPLPWRIRKVHGLVEHLRRLKAAREVSECDPLLRKSLDEVYQELVDKKGRDGRKKGY